MSWKGRQENDNYQLLNLIHCPRVGMPVSPLHTVDTEEEEILRDKPCACACHGLRPQGHLPGLADLLAKSGKQHRCFLYKSKRKQDGCRWETWSSSRQGRGRAACVAADPGEVGMVRGRRGDTACGSLAEVGTNTALGRCRGSEVGSLRGCADSVTLIEEFKAESSEGAEVPVRRAGGMHHEACASCDKSSDKREFAGS